MGGLLKTLFLRLSNAKVFGLFATCVVGAFCPYAVSADPYPIQFAIPECKIVSGIPEKTRDFATVIPSEGKGYIFNNESDYYADYQSSYYGVTCKKAGWDCLRHYEILANGCIPYFLDLDACDPRTMFCLPKDLIKEAMEIPGVSYLGIDHNLFDREKYYEILEKLLAYTREHLTTKHMAEYLLGTVSYKGNGKILFISGCLSPDYLRCLTLIGLKELYGPSVVDYPKVPHIYKSFGKIANLYGKGITYTKILDDFPVDRNGVEQRILRREFDLIVYGSIHRGQPFLETVLRCYSPDEIVYLCGEDTHDCCYLNYHNLFLREFN